MASSVQVTPDTPVTVKVNFDGAVRRFKLPLRDVGINVLERKLRGSLNIPADNPAIFERYSDSAAAYVVLDQANTAVYKQLYRAAKAKQKLKLRVTLKDKLAEVKRGPLPASVADAAEDDNKTSVAPTDTERENECLIPLGSTPDSEEQARASDAAAESEPAIDGDSDLKSAKREIDSGFRFCTDPKPPKPPKIADLGAGDAVLPYPPSCPALRANYAVCCNSCDRTIPDAHYHCSTCDDGDFDLCPDCVDRGVTCMGSNHWLIKRFVKNGVIINSTTERLAPKPKPKPAPTASDRVVPVFNVFSGMRTCNCCVQDLPEAELVHCTTCDDYDLCRVCFAKNRHGHHPKHAFVPAVEGTRLEPEVASRLPAGRGQPHNAICDGCDKSISGVRHKCLDCPDWDYCSDCIVNAPMIHTGHRFVPIYEPLPFFGNAVLHSFRRPVHVGICCDGPLCSAARGDSSYIIGTRYKCAICHDTDFCEACEASPANDHNRTHPLIKLKTPVRHVNVTTTGENQTGRPMTTMGDRPRSRPAATDRARAMDASRSPSFVSGVQTVVDVQPSEPVKAEEPEALAVAARPSPEVVAVAEPASAGDLFAMFVRDTVPDGTVLGPDHVFEQTWVLRNTGKVAWPPGCSVKFVGGDYMGHLDASHPAATSEVADSCASTICYASVMPGEEFPFTVLLRTPHRSGRVVSNWRLTTKDGLKFGHRLWCDVVVEKTREAPVPPAVADPVKHEDELEEKQEKQQQQQQQEEEVEEPVLHFEPEEEPQEEPVLQFEPEFEQEHSQMIFPKLEKESPVASVHGQTKVESAHDVSRDEPVKEDTEGEYEGEYNGEFEGEVDDAGEDDYEDEYEADFDDSNWKEADRDGSNGDKPTDGFLTDDEYDILDASDEEYQPKDSSKQK